MINISQLSKDGIGHQLHGIFTLMCMYNVYNYYYDAYQYIENIKSDNNSKRIEHISQFDNKQKLIDILLTIHKNFIKEFKTIKKDYLNYTKFQPILKLDDNENTLHYLDSNLFFNKDFSNIEDNETFVKNYNIIKSIFRKSLDITKNFKQTDIIIHIRYGNNAQQINAYNNIYKRTNYWNNIKNIIEKLVNNNKKITIHTDSITLDFLFKNLSNEKKQLVTIINEYDVLQTLRDFINCKTLIIGFSSLSTLAGLLSDNILIIPDDKINKSIGYDHSILNNNTLLLSNVL
tara:strand:+ start:5579 stop:6445 length:867 start_codon:yes stop_codon:yes gene_type:complete